MNQVSGEIFREKICSLFTTKMRVGIRTHIHKAKSAKPRKRLNFLRCGNSKFFHTTKNMSVNVRRR